MLRVVLVVEPLAEQRAAVLGALEAHHVLEVYEPEAAGPGAPPSVAQELATARGLSVRADARLGDAADAVALVREVAGRLDTGDEAGSGSRSGPRGAVVVVEASREVVRALIVHALEAPVAAGRLLIEGGTLAEVEVRVDAPWTVNRLNDGCHL
jgi:hypothetical protein